MPQFYPLPLQPSDLSCILSKEQSTFCLLKFSQEGFGLIRARPTWCAKAVKKCIPSSKSHVIHWDSIHFAHPAPFTCHIPSAWGPSFSTKQPNLRQVGRGLMWITGDFLVEKRINSIQYDSITVNFLPSLPNPPPRLSAFALASQPTRLRTFGKLVWVSSNCVGIEQLD